MLLDNLSDLSKLSKMFNKSGLFEFSERAQTAVRFLECFLISTYKKDNKLNIQGKEYAVWVSSL